MKRDLRHSPIFITGAARSGASMIAGIINICGAFGGVMSPPNKDYKKGMFENIQITNSIVKPYFESMEMDVKGQYPMPSLDDLLIPTHWGQRVLQIMDSEGYVGGNWMYKSPLLNMIYPVWQYAFPNARWIIVRRQDDDIVESCIQTKYMNAFDTDIAIKSVNAKDKKDAWYWWVRQHNVRFMKMIESGLNCKQIHPERMVFGDYSQINEMLDWLGLKWDTEIVNFIEPKLWNVRKNL